MYRFRSDGSLKTESQIRQENPNTSFPSVWTKQFENDFGVDKVLDSVGPETNRYQIAYHDGVEQNANGDWVWKWGVSEVTEEARAAIDNEQARAVRDTRDNLLKECDWTQVADAPVDRAAWAAYRQELRDVPKQSGFPWDITWPTPPQ
jgi:hypothetical protein